MPGMEAGGGHGQRTGRSGCACRSVAAAGRPERHTRLKASCRPSSTAATGLPRSCMPHFTARTSPVRSALPTPQFHQAHDAAIQCTRRTYGLPCLAKTRWQIASKNTLISGGYVAKVFAISDPAFSRVTFRRYLSSEPHRGNPVDNLQHNLWRIIGHVVEVLAQVLRKLHGELLAAGRSPTTAWPPLAAMPQPLLRSSGSPIRSPAAPATAARGVQGGAAPLRGGQPCAAVAVLSAGSSPMAGSSSVLRQ